MIFLFKILVLYIYILYIYILKIILKIKKYYFNIFLNKNTLKNNYYSLSNHLTFFFNCLPLPFLTVSHTAWALFFSNQNNIGLSFCFGSVWERKSWFLIISLVITAEKTARVGVCSGCKSKWPYFFSRVLGEKDGGS
jgi:hypothetical protein